MTRVQANVIAKSERALLTWLCARLPAWLTPDRLTVLGVCGALLVLVAQLASRAIPAFLWLASFGLLVHWFGDSLDGSVARFRRIERPVYGYFLDHTVDAACNLLIMVGFGSTLGIRMDIALYALVAYFMLCMYVFINNHLSGVFQLSFVGMGPTELRMFLIGINIWMFFGGPVHFTVAGEAFSPYDVLIGCGATIMVAIFAVRVAIGIRALRDSRPDAPRPADAA